MLMKNRRILLTHLSRSVRYPTIIYAHTLVNLKVYMWTETKLCETRCEPERQGKMLVCESVSYFLN